MAQGGVFTLLMESSHTWAELNTGGTVFYLGDAARPAAPGADTYLCCNYYAFSDTCVHVAQYEALVCAHAVSFYEIFGGKISAELLRSITQCSGETE